MDADLNNIRLQMPPRNDVPLLGPGSPWRMNACLHFSHDMTHGYVEGYRKAAEKLVEFVEQTRQDQDYLVYPTVFLYRHHLELRLKELLDLLHVLGLKRFSAPGGHNLSQLWLECEPCLKSLSETEDKGWFFSVGRCIDQLVAIDPASDAFRYAKKRDGSKSAPTLRHINLVNLRTTMEPILDWLEGASSYLRDNQSNLDEWS